jgi:prophage regulatory protein
MLNRTRIIGENRTRLERQSKFPKRITVGPQRYAWIESELDKWIESRIRARDEAAA